MLLDKQVLFSDAQAITSTAVSTNKVDRQGGLSQSGGTSGFTTDNLGNTVPSDPGTAPELDVEVVVTEAFTAAGAATLQVQLCADDDSALGSPTVLQQTDAIGKATLVPGYRFRLSLPPGMAVADRYIGLNYIVATGPMTAGKVTAAVVARGNRQTAPNTWS